MNAASGKGEPIKPYEPRAQPQSHCSPITVGKSRRYHQLIVSLEPKATKLLCQIPSIGPIRAALLTALIQTAHRFRTKRPLWKCSGFAIETHSSADYRSVEGQLQRSRYRTNRI